MPSVEPVVSINDDAGSAAQALVVRDKVVETPAVVTDVSSDVQESSETDEASSSTSSSSTSTDSGSTASAGPPKPWSCYMLGSATGRRTYTGATTDPERRLSQHNGERSGGAKATRTGRPWRLLLTVTGFRSKQEALCFEWRLKHRPGKSNARLRPVVGGMALRLANVYAVLNLQRWTSKCDPAMETPLVLTWHDEPLAAHCQKALSCAARSLPPYVQEVVAAVVEEVDADAAGTVPPNDAVAAAPSPPPRLLKRPAGTSLAEVVIGSAVFSRPLAALSSGACARDAIDLD